METVLVSGGNGLIGRHLCRRLKDKGYNVAILSRKSFPGQEYIPVHWDPANKKIVPEAVAMADYIIHLAGAGIGDRRWSEKRKQEIINSRVDSAQLLYEAVTANPGKLKAFVSSSATGYYGAYTSEAIYQESSPPAGDFLGETCRLWEEAALCFERMGIRTVRIRTGVVLTRQGGALAKMAALTRFGLGSPLGSGRQYLPWIHVDDLCGIYLKALEDPGMRGAFNAVAPYHVTNREFFSALAAAYKKTLWLPRVPAFALKLLFGEMAAVLLEGSRVSSEKIRAEGYSFLFPDLKKALEDLVTHRG